jgi:predicted dinucleotide-binding enzyme
MRSVTIFGSGNMGKAIGNLLRAAGASVQYVNKGVEATIDGDVVILAVPYESLDDIAKRYGDQLRNRIVVDITNPVDFETFDALKVPGDSSAAVALQDTLPDATVLKAFNINFAETLSAKRVGQNTTTLVVAGDDDVAKATLMELARAADLVAVDGGSLARARELEAMGFLQIVLANAEQTSWSAGFGLVTD